ncbi:MAG TPA: exodeoxyribonuclease VII large subunit [Terriglobales bacterium]|nr:exodeoxyribonuclease VII large subunit [Terriglobales bacterium]
MSLQASFEFPPSARKVWSVSGLLASLKQTLDREFFEVWIEGEISNFHQAASRHCYFTLKDATGQMRAAMFATQARFLKFKLRDGMQVLVRGRVSVYEARGELQCYVEHVEPLGHGALQIAFEQLKQKLEAEGLFAAARKRPLPVLPRRVGLVTSARGAAVADMMQILRRRYPNIGILLYPVAVQGEAAAGEIVEALAHFARQQAGDRDWVDVLIVGRGGGSLEDLWPFNEEAVARALTRLPMPVVSAVGHETDFTIADFVADLRAPTPSAAAELVVRPKEEFAGMIAAGLRHLQQAARFGLLHRRQKLADWSRHRAFHALTHRLMQRAQRVDELNARMQAVERVRLEEIERRLATAAQRVQQHDVRTRLARVRAALEAQQQAILTGWRSRVTAQGHRLAALEAVLRERDPLSILSRGYALVYDAQGRLATTPAGFADGDALRLRLAQGWLDAEVKKRTGVLK